MNPSSAQTATALEANRRSSRTSLHGSWLVLARVLWVVLVVFCWGGFAASLPVYIARLQTVCVHGPCVFGQLSVDSARAVRQIGFSPGSYSLVVVAFTAISVLVYMTVVLVIFWHKSDDWMALLVALTLATFVQTFGLGGRAWFIFTESVVLLQDITLFLLLVLFPDGRFVPRWMCWFTLVFLPLGVIDTLFPNVMPFGSLPTFLVGLAFGGTLLGALIYRYRYASGPVERQQTKWVVFSLSISGLGGFLLSWLPYLFPAFLPPSSPYQVFYFFATNGLNLLIPLSFGVAVFRYRLWDIDIIINRTLVYGILTTIVVGVYVLIVGLLGRLFQTQGNVLISLLATGLIAVLFQPLRSRLQRAVNRLMFGERDEPYVVISRLGQRLEATLAPDAILPTIVETVVQALKLPYAAIGLMEDDTLTIAASYGVEAVVLLRFPLVYQNKQIGELVLAARSPGESFSPADRRLLDDLARQAGVAAHAVRLTADLQRSRERLVTAREEERRRLRRDLHDGLGPQLASQTLTLTAVRKLLRQDPEAAEMLLSDAVTHAQQAITDIRRLVYDLRPPALDDLGLVGALREQLQQYRSSDVAFTLEAPEHLPPLSAAVEVACYRIVQESLTNVVRHAHASTCTVCLTLGEPLSLDIIDDGIGLQPAYRTGVGLNSMRERATELGGTCVIEPIPAGGTRVCVRLPMS
jgi:signal transduction histidine kinase